MGAPKAGSTSLFFYLRQHPQIYMSPVKEPNFFATEYHPEHMASPVIRRMTELDAPALAAYIDGPMEPIRFGGNVADWEQYLKLFRFATTQPAIGEASVGYLWTQSAAAGIHERIPGARIVMVLRNPAERAFSQYLQAMTTSRAPAPFGRLIRERAAAGPERIDRFSPFLDFGRYHQQVARFLERFPASQIRLYLYEEYARDPAAILRDLFGWLGVAPDASVDLSRRHREPHLPRFPTVERYLTRPAEALLRGVVPAALRRAIWRMRFPRRARMTMAPEDRRFLAELYADDVTALGKLIDRDLRAWLPG